MTEIPNTITGRASRVLAKYANEHGIDEGNRFYIGEIADCMDVLPMHLGNALRTHRGALKRYLEQRLGYGVILSYEKGERGSCIAISKA